MTLPSSPYREIVREIGSLERFGSRLGLSRIRLILKELGEPQKSCRCILVGGSNGKGSTVEMIGSILNEQGFTVGTYFSPQLSRFADRFRVDGRNATCNEIAEAYGKVKLACRKMAPHATFFEVVTAMALMIFKQREVDAAVLEVGLGGRLDATNAVEPEISAITSLSLEHTDVLGSTIEEIAHEKCGIARKGRLLACGVMGKREAWAIAAECKKSGALPVFAGRDILAGAATGKEGLLCFTSEFAGKKYRISLGAPGKFQVSNALVALAACAKYGASKNAIEKGLLKAKPRFRLEKISSSPEVIADCCHNPEAASALALEAAAMEGRKVLLFSAMKDKDYAEVLKRLAPHFERVVVCQVKVDRGERLEKLMWASKKAGKDAVAVRNPKRALSLAKSIAGDKGIVMIAGSVYLLNELFGKDGKSPEGNLCAEPPKRNKIGTAQ